MEPTTAVERLLPELRRYAWSLTGRMDRADDLVEAFLQLRLWRAGQPAAVERAQLFRRLRTFFVEDQRSGRGEMTLAEPAGTWAAARERGRLAELRLAFALLPADQREVLNLVVMDGMSYEEAGAILDVPAATVQLRIAQARSELAQEIGGGGMITIPKGSGHGVDVSAVGDDDLGADPGGGGALSRDHRRLS